MYERLLVFPYTFDSVVIFFNTSPNSRYMEFISKLNDEADNTGIWTNCFNHLAEYFLNLPGNQRLN